MSPTPIASPVAKDFKAARSQFLQLYGSTQVMNTYLKIAVVCLSLVSVGLVGVVVKAISSLRDRRPLVVGVDSSGRPRVLTDENLVYRPHESEIKFFLTHFVHDHYARMRATMKEDYDRSLYFLEAPLANSVIESNKNSKDIEAFLGGQVRRITLDYELKRRAYSPLAKERPRSEEYKKRQAEVAAQYGLKVVRGHIQLPDLRIEYETANGEIARRDLELATPHYRGRQLASKAEAGFHFYASAEDRGRLSAVFDDHHITTEILSL